MTSFVADPAQQQGLIPSGETVRWSGAPPDGLLLRRSDALGIPMSLLVALFAVVWAKLAVQSGGVFMMLWGVPLVGYALYGAVGRLIWDAYVRGHTRYVVTDQAAYVVTGGVSGGTRRFAGDLLSDVRVERNRDGTGALHFGPDTQPPWWNRRQPWPTPQRNVFEAISDVDGAYAAVLAAQRAQS